MMFARIPKLGSWRIWHVGGLAYVPPAPRLRTSHVPDYTAARADPPGSAHSDATRITRPAGRGAEDSPTQPSEGLA